MPTGGLDVAAGSFLADTLGTTAAGILGSAALGTEVGAGLGGLESAVSGGNILKGVEKGGIGGALTGGGIGIGGDLLGSSLGATVGDALGGAAGGALGGLATKSNPLTGALEGGAAGTLAGLTSSPAGGGASGSAASAAAPSSIGAAGATGGDATLNSDIANNFAANGPTVTGGGAVPQSEVGQLFNGTGTPSQVGSDLSSPVTSNVGSGTVGTPGISGGTNGFQPSLSSPVANAIASTGGAASTATAPTSLQDFVGHPSFDNAVKILTSNPSAALSGVSLGIDALKQGQELKGQRQVQNEAGQLAGQGQQLEQYLQTGTLPPGLQTGITQAADAAKATIRSQYAAKGMSGSSAEAQDLANVDSSAQAEGAQLGLQLLNTGISESGMASQLYQSILSSALEKDKDLSSAISSFASSAGGGGQAGQFKIVPSS